MAGSISLSMQTIFGNVGQLLAGGKVFFIEAGTTSDPQNAFYDADLTAPLPNPYPLDASGRMPAFYLADGQIKVRIVDANGVQQYAQDNILVVGPSSGGGGGGGVDPSTVFQTGDVMWLDVQGSRSGWVRDNGRTIGSASSGATERANADCSALYAFYYNNFSDTICPVTGGRGANAAADFAANKPIATPDRRRTSISGLDDMGNTAAGGLANVPVAVGGVTTAGSIVGENLHTLVESELPAVSKQTGDNTTITARFKTNSSNTDTTGGAAQRLDEVGKTNNNQGYGAVEFTANHQHTFAFGSGTAHNTVPRSALGTWYRKL